jgi:Zn-dependent peptidase ImmA (M78 family)
MQLYSYRGHIKVCADERQLADVYRNLFGVSAGERHLHSFYVYEVNTIYITKESFDRFVLGHEIGHAVISNYFVVQPPVRVQEVLAGYVEYQLRKAS